jgi:hypothetical protein
MSLSISLSLSPLCQSVLLLSLSPPLSSSLYVKHQPSIPKLITQHTLSLSRPCLSLPLSLSFHLSLSLSHSNSLRSLSLSLPLSTPFFFPTLPHQAYTNCSPNIQKHPFALFSLSLLLQLSLSIPLYLCLSPTFSLNLSLYLPTPYLLPTFSHLA